MDKVIVISGSKQGIGRYLSEYYLNKNFNVVGCDLFESDLQHEKYEHYCLDVSNERSVKKMISDIYKKYNHIDYLVNNAGVASMNHSLLTPLSVVEKVFKTNVFGTFLFCRETAKIMSKKRKGRIINFSSVAVPLDLEGEAVYAASKASIEKLTTILAKEFGKNGITVNAIGPSPIRTALIKNVGEDKLNKLLSQQAIAKFGSFKDIVNVIDFFISDNSDMITGQIIYLGGVF